MSNVSPPRTTAETAAISVTRAEWVVRYTQPTPAKAQLTTLSRLAVAGLPFVGRWRLGGGLTGAGPEVPIITPLVATARPHRRLYSYGPCCARCVSTDIRDLRKAAATPHV